MWKRVISNRISSDGMFSMEEGETESTSEVPSTSAQDRRRPSPVSPPALMPAMKMPRLSCEESESDMDLKLQDYFVGMCVKITCLSPLFIRSTLRLPHAPIIIPV